MFCYNPNGMSLRVKPSSNDVQCATSLVHRTPLGALPNKHLLDLLALKRSKQKPEISMLFTSKNSHLRSSFPLRGSAPFA